jgi:hypothetical protein
MPTQEQIAKYNALSDEEKLQFQKEVEEEIKRRSGPGRVMTGLKRMGIGALRALPYALRDEAMPEESTEPGFYEKEAYKEKIKEQDPFRQAQIKAIEHFTTPEKKMDLKERPEAPPYINEALQDIPEEERKYYKVTPTFQTIGGVPVVVDTKTELTEQGKRYFEAQRKEKATEIGAKGEVLKLGEKARANFGRAIGMFSTIVAQAKGMGEEQKEALGKFGVETTGLGLLPGAAGGVAVATRRSGFGRTAAFRGQQKETAISLNSILTGQNRVIRSVVQMIQETLPTTNDPEDIMATKLAQSITNAYRLVKAFQKAGLTPQKLEQMNETQLDEIDARGLVALYTLTPEEEAELQKVIDDVLKTPAMPARTFEEEGIEDLKSKYGLE